MKLEFSGRIFGKYSDIKFHENPSSGSRVNSMRTDGRTDVPKLTVAFSNFAGAPKKVVSIDERYCEAPEKFVMLTNCKTVGLMLPVHPQGLEMEIRILPVVEG